MDTNQCSAREPSRSTKKINGKVKLGNSRVKNFSVCTVYK